MEVLLLARTSRVPALLQPRPAVFSLSLFFFFSKLSFLLERPRCFLLLLPVASFRFPRVSSFLASSALSVAVLSLANALCIPLSLSASSLFSSPGIHTPIGAAPHTRRPVWVSARSSLPSGGISTRGMSLLLKKAERRDRSTMGAVGICLSFLLLNSYARFLLLLFILLLVAWLRSGLFVCRCICPPLCTTRS